MERIKGNIQDCLQHEAAFCAAVCPFHLDVRDFIEKMQRGAFNAAFRLYLNSVGFPGIVAALCDEPCKKVCPRRDVDAAISMRLLEGASMQYARNTEPNNYNLPAKKRKVAVIGAGISGLACALRLASKKYDVTVFERSDRVGGHLWEQLPPDVFLKDIERQFMYEQYTLRTGTEIKDLERLEYEAIYVATGAGGDNFGLQSDPGGAFASTTPGVFLGGSLLGRTSMQAIADGLRVTAAIERFLKAGSMNQPVEAGNTKLEIDPARITPAAAVVPANGSSYSQEEAVEEAKRCLRCSCDACMRYCDLMRFYKKFPKRIAEEVELTIHPGTLDGNGTLATRLITTCNQCGLCEEVCPIHINTGDFLLLNHRVMREKGAMPWAYHEFWLRDMDFSNGEAAQLSRMPVGCEQSRYVFFPGCQLGASEPEYVMESYRWLLSKENSTALMLNCCGSPAEWAGDEKIHAEVIRQLREHWNKMGRPVAVFACPTCKQMFERHLPEIEGVFLYDLFVKWGISLPENGHGESVSVFDPCSSRGEPGVQASVRSLVERAGFDQHPLPLEKELAACCSWGGQVSNANPRYAREVVSARITQNDLPYVVYCSNCRDIFAAAQKPVYHLLDIVLGLHDSSRRAPTLSKRRDNRSWLKRQALKVFWNEEVVMEPEDTSIKLVISSQARQKLSNEMILESEAAAVVEYCENSSRKVLDSASGHFLGHLQIGSMTYWVEYYPSDEGFVLVNAYSHRMSIEEV